MDPGSCVPRDMRTRTQCGRDWVIPEDYDYTKSTKENYHAPGRGFFGPHAQIRAGLDHAYHGNYTEERQHYQDLLVGNVVGAGERHECPWIVFSAGAMGAGKTYVVSWLSEREYFPLEDIVHIDMDQFRAAFEEWPG